MGKVNHHETQEKADSEGKKHQQTQGPFELQPQQVQKSLIRIQCAHQQTNGYGQHSHQTKDQAIHLSGYRKCSF
jgi:hypothetical protein